ncbi:MAG: Zn-ribbon domain-containing OB-fold protein [Acidimicrobiia bacterium]
MSDHEVPFRILPRVIDLNRHFWTGGEDGELRFLRCQDDGTYVHPPSPRCPNCLGKNVSPEDVSGRATVVTYSINHQQWMPGPEVPYVVAIVEIVEQEGVRLTTNIVNCDVHAVRIGMPVRVVFEEHADGDERVWIPLFEPMKTDGEQ